MTQSKAEEAKGAHFSSLVHLLQPCKILYTENSKWKRIDRTAVSTLTIYVRVTTKREGKNRFI